MNFSSNIIRKRILKRKIANITEKMKEIRKFVTKNMKNASKKQRNNAKKHRKNIKYEIENLIEISIKNIIINRLLHKLNHKIIDLCFIIKIINSSYQIQLFESIKEFDTFHFNFLKKTFEDLLSSQINESTSSIVINKK